METEPSLPSILSSIETAIISVDKKGGRGFLTGQSCQRGQRVIAVPAVRCGLPAPAPPHR
jgi:hypothetical protein